MASPIIRSEGNRWGGCHCNKCVGTEEAQSREMGSGSLAENSFAAKNSVEERRTMANLEKTMQAALSFASGGEEPDNSPWIVHILLGRMIRERTAIGRAIKSLAKFQHREIMCGLVKLGDLEHLVDPLLLGSLATPPSPQRLQNEEGVQMNAENYCDLPSGGYLRPKDSPSRFPPLASN